jgi:hypothetical protein
MFRPAIAHHLARRLCRWVLLCFALSLGAAIASPLVNPQAMELICSGSGAMKVLIKTDDGAKEATSVTLDCPLCTTPAAPPCALRVTAAPVQPLAHVLQTIPAARIASLTAAPPPARGPPAL